MVFKYKSSEEMNTRKNKKINWKNPKERLAFENDLKIFRAEKKKRSRYQKCGWFTVVFILQFGLVVLLYGTCAYFIVSLAIHKKNEEELILLQRCYNESQLKECAKKCDPTRFEYNDIQNYILINCYPYLTVFCQGTAFVMVSLWHVTDYRLWNVLGGITATLCLPVDIWIFYLEPLGFTGTSTAMVLAFVPYCIVIADAAFPVKPMNVVANGKIIKINRNSWTGDLSMSYNQRYNFVARITLKGWTAFSTVALCIPLFKGGTLYENALGTVILTLEGIPQMMSLALGMIHWDATFDQLGFEVFESLVDMPLVLWYLSFYCSPKTKNAVIGKLFLNCVSMFLHRYGEYIEKYLYVEGDVDEGNKGWVDDYTEIKCRIRCGLPAYDSSKFKNVFMYHTIYLIACPFVGMWECFMALKAAFNRDFK